MGTVHTVPKVGFYLRLPEGRRSRASHQLM
jgi:hypothetical protein